MKRIKRDIIHKSNTNKHYYWWYECKCGQLKSRRSDNKAEYCNMPGCKYSNRIRHGKSNSPLYCIWEGIKQRLFNPNAKSASTYNGKGITMCTDWLQYIPFEKWALLNGYKQGLTIDRINIDGNYTPDNCQWITRSENTLLQHKDGHGTAKAIIATKGTIIISYVSMSAMARQLILEETMLINFPKTTRAISYAIKNKKDYYGWTIKYE